MSVMAWYLLGCKGDYCFYIASKWEDRSPCQLVHVDYDLNHEQNELNSYLSYFQKKVL